MLYYRCFAGVFRFDGHLSDIFRGDYTLGIGIRMPVVNTEVTDVVTPDTDNPPAQLTKDGVL